MAEAPKTIVLTGATFGLGEALADELIKAGHRIYGCGRSQPQLDQLNQRHSSQGVFERVNVADDAEVRRWAEKIIHDAGAPDLVINNAAIINRSAPLWELEADEMAQLTAININGTAFVMQSFLPAMIERGSGVVVNLSSGWGRSTSPEVAPYCASKWAVEGLSQAVAQEVPHGLAVVSLNPGIINTRMLQSSFGGSASGYQDATSWAQKAAPFLVKLSAKDNGKQLTAP